MSLPALPPAPETIGRVCFDFDGTLAEGSWPSPTIGKIIRSGVSLLLRLHGEGREIIVYTARPESHRPRIMAWLRLAGLEDVVYDVVCGKPVADLYVDDKAYNPVIGTYGGVPLREDPDVRVRDGMLPEEEDGWVKRMLGAVNG